MPRAFSVNMARLGHEDSFFDFFLSTTALYAELAASIHRFSVYSICLFQKSGFFAFNKTP